MLAAFRITARVLRRGGAFVAKIFRGRDIDLLFAQVTMVKGKEFINDINSVTSEIPIIGTIHPFPFR